MELSYVNAYTLVRTIGGASGEHLGAFVGSLILPVRVGGIGQMTDC